MKLLILFGSTSDENISTPLIKALSGEFEVEYEAISAHRELEKLEQKMKEWRGDAVIAGAGLAAALPGVVAAMTSKPVFGVPVPSQFGGLDSFASIAQMPPGVPVLTCGPAGTGPVVTFLKQYKNSLSRRMPGEGGARAIAREGEGLSCPQHSDDNGEVRNGPLPNPLPLSRERGLTVHFVSSLNHPDLQAEIEKAKALGVEKGVTVTVSPEKNAAALNVVVVSGPEEVRKDDFCLHVPFLPKAIIGDPAAYLPVLEWANLGGLWLGVNNTRNAVQAAVRLVG